MEHGTKTSGQTQGGVLAKLHALADQVVIEQGTDSRDLYRVVIRTPDGVDKPSVPIQGREAALSYFNDVVRHGIVARQIIAAGGRIRCISEATWINTRAAAGAAVAR